MNLEDVLGESQLAERHVCLSCGRVWRTENLYSGPCGGCKGLYVRCDTYKDRPLKKKKKKKKGN